MSAGRILVIDDDLSLRQFLTIMLERAGYTVKAAANGGDGLKLTERHDFDLVITDLSMPDISGMEVLSAVKERSPETEVIMITAYATTESAVEAMKQGAYDYIIKPFKNEELKLVVEKALRQQHLSQENRLLRKQLKTRDHYQNIIGPSAPMQQVFELIEKVKDTRINVLITGESGTGKELVARAIHYSGVRADAPFVGINCSAIPDSLIESELFGHKKGSFTGAVANKKGLFEVAGKGTLFLDEVGELPLATQVKLLRAIQERRILAVGGLEEVEVDVRIISATNRELEKEVAEGRFREDLYYRLHVVPLRLPALRERRQDIMPLLDHFLNKYSKEYGVDRLVVDEDALQPLMDYDYPGNVRELENLIERCVALGTDGRLTARLLPRGLHASIDDRREPDELLVMSLPPDGTSMDEVLESRERAMIVEALRRTNGRKKEAARLLGISFRSFRYRLGKLGIDDYRDEPTQS